MQSPTHRLPILTALLVLSATTLLAQGGGPLQPEFTGSPVPAGPNVNEFTGDFTYGLPVMTVPGPYGSSYTISLSYRAGTNPNAEVGWVGYGWSLNPGSIVREKRGFPDDWSGEVVYHNKQPLDYTISVSGIANTEFASIDKGVPGAGGTFTRRYNNNTGFGTIWSLSAGVNLLGQYGGIQYTNDNGDGSFAPVLTPNLVAFFASTQTDNESEGEKSTTKSDEPSPSFFERGLRRSAQRMLNNGNMPNLFASREFTLAPPVIVPITGDIDDIGLGLDVSALGNIVTRLNLGARANASEFSPEPRTTLTAYGYLLSDRAEENDLMDYAYEKDVPFTLKDNLLPVPFSTPDVFTVTGGGSFRAFNRNPGTFWQNAVSSTIDLSVNIPNGIIVAGPPFGFGLGYRWGDGSITYRSGRWDDPDAVAWRSFSSSGDEPWFFRYTHDGGGSLLYDKDDKAVRAALVEHTDGLGEFLDWVGINDYDRFAVPPSDLRLHLESWERPGRNGYVGFTRNSQMLESVNDKYYKSYNVDEESRDLVADRSEMPDQIGEFALFGTGRSRYVYGLPIHVRGQLSVQLGLRNIKLDSAASVDHNLYAHRWIDQYSAQKVMGQEVSSPYATAWLLTEITTPDYVDVTGDGPTDEDLGGWTQFHYRRAMGGNSWWDFWRTPFNGLLYDPVDISDPEDDLGGFSRGQRERYYLDRIETKTHIALFILNDSVSARRNDGYLPKHPKVHYPEILSDYQYAGDKTTGLPGNSTISDPRYLDRIELYTKDAAGNPDSLLTTVHFEYDYSLRENMLNSLIESGSDRYGMLTLRKVRTESHNVKNATIHPILFGYEYKTSEDYSEEMQARYPEVTSYADNLTDALQNPDYNPYDFDAWGSYRPGGTNRLDKRISYVPQNQTAAWDPAAWQLKWVRSPIGGELHIQYEEDDYAFVQDRPTLAMVSLIEVAGGGFSQESFDGDNDNKYYLRLSDIGIDSTDLGEVLKVRELIHKEAERHQRLFFRFLYAMKGTSPSVSSPEYNSTYIAGHVNLAGTEIDTITTPNKWYALSVNLVGKNEGGSVHDHGVPRKVCIDYVKKRKRGKLNPNDGIKYTDNDADLAFDLVGKFFSFIGGDFCQEIDYANSYIRIPTLQAKKGGGLRVKRLLSYDPGIEGDSALYGTEYRYELYDPERNELISSGVAANEPSLIRDENPLVTFRERSDDEDFAEGKIAAGRDRARNEGPIGETLLPSASIGYARVATYPIHQGATTSGFSITDFYTHRDYPYDGRYPNIGRAVEYTDLTPDEYKTSPLFSNLLVYRQSEHLVFATQGFRFVKTDMPGKVRRQLANGGIYTPFERDWITSASTETLYYQPGDSIPLLYHFGDSIRYGYPGKEMEVIQANRRNGSYLDRTSVEGDAGILFPFPPAPFFSGAAYHEVENTQLSTHVITKVVNYPAIPKGVLSFADGNYNYTEYVAFDPRSGQPLVSRSRDAFDGKTLHQSPGGHVGTYHSYAVPLAERYPELGPISGNERAFIDTVGGFAVYKGTNGTTAYLDFPGGSENTWLKKLTPGDLVELTLVTPQSGETDAGRYHVEAIQGNVVLLDSSLNYNAALDPAFARNGRVFVEVIRSGRANVPGMSLGSVTTYGETAEEVAVGANISWSGGDAAGRLALVSTLNSLYGSGSGTINSSNVDANLKVRHYTTGTCATVSGLGESWNLSTSGDTIFIGMASYTDTIVDQGMGGWFDLDDAGQIVFRSIGYLADLHRRRLNPTEQRVLNFTFCGDDPALHAVAGVIAGSAGVISDTVDYDGGGVLSVNDQHNAFEKGERGRWSPRTAYIYRTDVVPSSDQYALERIYKDGGVFNEFSLFNWTEPGSSDTTHWIRLGEVTRINKHNIPYSSVDPLGRSTTTVFDYGPVRNLLPVLTAWNAEEATVAFESFEVHDDGDLSGNVSDDRAHAGTKSITLGASAQSTYNMEIAINDHLLEKGGILRFWSTHDGDDIRVKYASGASTLIVPERLARAGEWVLYEATFRADSLGTYYSSGSSMLIRFRNEGGAALWIDDVKFQPSDAIAGATVFDPRTFRPVAGFDDQNFGVYPVYDGRSSGYASLVETSRGLFTIGDMHAHIPGTPRDWLGEGSPFTGTMFSGSGNPASSFNGSASANEGSTDRVGLDLIDLHIGLSGTRLRTFGLDPAELKAEIRKRGARLSAEEDALLDRYEALSLRYDEVVAGEKEGAAERGEERLARELETIEAERDAILKQLGVHPEDLNR